MFSKSGRWYFPGQDVGTVMQTVTGIVHGQGISLAPSGPNRWEGTGAEWSMGVVPKMTVYLRPDQQGFWVDAHLGVDLGGGAVAILILCWMFCFPAAIVFMILANQSFDQNAERVMQGTYQGVAHLTGQPPMAAIGGPPPGWG